MLVLLLLSLILNCGNAVQTPMNKVVKKLVKPFGNHTSQGRKLEEELLLLYGDTPIFKNISIFPIFYGVWSSGANNCVFTSLPHPPRAPVSPSPIPPCRPSPPTEEIEFVSSFITNLGGSPYMATMVR